jgi:Hemerythrin HHE cation binding domain
MKIDTTEITAVTQATTRVDLYGVIHKALRAMMADSLLAIGRMDSSDATERASTAKRVQALLDFCASHLEHENLWVHPAIEARAPGASARIAHEHDSHRQHIAALQATLALLTQAPDADCAAAAAQSLYRELGLFMADNFLHMHTEETTHNALLWARYTDAELLDIHAALVGAIPAEEMAAVLRWMLPTMNPQERAAMLADMRQTAPAPVFEATLDIARQHLDATSWARLARSLGLAPAAGLVNA